jgi:ankyrin repeat protein
MANAVEAQKISDLCAAAYAGDIRRLQAALSSGAEVNGYDATGMTALTRASIAGHEHIVTELISAKADVSRHDSVRPRKNKIGSAAKSILLHSRLTHSLIHTPAAT